MATIDDTGVIPKTLTEYQEELRTAFRAAFGESIDLDAKSPQGQWVDSLALSFSQADDALVSVAGAVNIFRAFASQLEGLAALLGININEAQSTLVTVDLGGTPATVIPAGSRGRSDAGDLYQLNDETTLDGAGTASATMSAVEAGPIEILTGELTSVVDVVPGWETINNPSDGTTGRNKESDSAYRQRYFTELFRNALSVLDSIIAAVSEVDTVTEVIGAENDTSVALVVQNVSIDPHSIAMVVEGGLDQDIADAIRLKKTGGTGTTGTTSVPDAPHTDINFFRPSDIEIEITITTTPGANFPSNGLELLKQRTLDYINGELDLSSDSDLFEIDGMKISEDLQKHRLYTPINSVPGHSVSGLTLEDTASPGDVDTIVADLNQKIKFASIDDINVTLL